MKPPAPAPKPAAPPLSIPLDRLVIVHRSPDGVEHDRATGPELAALLCGIRPENRKRLFNAGDITMHLVGLADVLGAISDHDDTPEHLSNALFIVGQGLRALIPRVEAFEEDAGRAPADYYTAEMDARVGGKS